MNKKEKIDHTSRIILIGFIIGSLFLILTNTVIGYSNRGVIQYFNCDNSSISGNTIIDNVNGYNGYYNNPSLNTGVIHDACQIATSTSYINTSILWNTYYEHDFSINFWIKSQSYLNARFIGTGTGYSPNICFALATPNVYVEGTAGNLYTIGTNAIWPLYNDNAWHMITITKVGGREQDYKFYVDGVQNTGYANQGGNTIPYDDTGYYATFVNDIILGNGIDGYLDEYAIFDYALTTDNVTDLYNASYGNAINIATCSESWIENDTSCNGYNATIIFMDSNRCNTSINLPVDNATLYNCSCAGNWSLITRPCIDNSRFIYYENNIGCHDDLPIDNNTYLYCEVTGSSNVNINNFKFDLSSNLYVILLFIVFVLISLSFAVYSTGIYKFAYAITGVILYGLVKYLNYTIFLDHTSMIYYASYWINSCLYTSVVLLVLTGIYYLWKH